ncbi:hypothetical protein ACLMJK_002560 [Lecanora helva]
MAPFFTNNSCNPFLPQDEPCTVGNYVAYAVNASNIHDIQVTVKFARERNIRLTIRNTGHDYNGKATGAGAIAVWTHYMKSMGTMNYTGSTYAGMALKFGAGVQTGEAYQYAHDRGLVIVGGNVPSVGLAGGYTQGGGHSPLSSILGLAADQALEWEVVTAEGDHLTASPTQNSDLYWALSGGGGGTYAIATSLTVKAHKDLMNSAANLTFSSEGASEDSFWNVVETFQVSLPSIVDAGAVAVFSLTNESFTLGPLQGPGLSKAHLEQLLGPTISRLKKENIKYNFLVDEYPTFYDSYKSYDPPVNVSQYQIGGRLIPRTLVQKNISALVSAERSILGSGSVAFISGVCVNVSVTDPTMNSVNPIWRTSLFDAVVATPFSYMNPESNIAFADMTTHKFLPLLEALTPSGGAYLNEADFQQPDFQSTLYGPNYQRLRSIKSRYDPDDMFYAVTAVGSEDWFEDQSRGGCSIRGLIAGKRFWAKSLQSLGTGFISSLKTVFAEEKAGQ